MLEYIIRVGKPKTIVFSTFGVREGLLYEMLPPQERAKDGFICAAQTLNGLLSRSARHAEELVAWTDRLVRVVKLRETAEDRRLRHAACLLSDIGWRVHPDHRGEETLSLITNGNFGSISHQGRAFVALSVFYRYAGLSEENEPPTRIRELVPPAMDERARILGAAFRVAHLISAARTGVLPATHFRSRGRKLMLVFEHRMVDLVADRVGSRFKQLARLVGRCRLDRAELMDRSAPSLVISHISDITRAASAGSRNAACGLSSCETSTVSRCTSGSSAASLVKAIPYCRRCARSAGRTPRVAG